MGDDRRIHRLVQFHLDGVPAAPKGSGTRTKTGAYIEQAGPRLKRYQVHLAHAARDATTTLGLAEPMTGPILVRLRFGLPRPAANRDEYPHRTTRGDIDKLVRAALDAIVTGGVLADDKLIVELSASVGWDDRHTTMVQVCALQ